MITAEKLATLIGYGPGELSMVLHDSGYTGCNFESAHFIGITNGGQPVTWIGMDGVVRSYLPPPTVAVNTLGAGDVFRSRLAIGVCLGESLDDAVPGACVSACEHITEKPLTRLIP